jgi:hypothetical protein
VKGNIMGITVYIGGWELIPVMFATPFNAALALWAVATVIAIYSCIFFRRKGVTLFGIIMAIIGAGIGGVLAIFLYLMSSGLPARGDRNTGAKGIVDYLSSNTDILTWMIATFPPLGSIILVSYVIYFSRKI